MKIDEITDIEVLRELAKASRVKMIKDAYANDGSDYWFKANEWYLSTQDEDGVTLFSDGDSDATLDLTYEEAERYLFKDKK